MMVFHDSSLLSRVITNISSNNSFLSIETAFEIVQGIANIFSMDKDNIVNYEVKIKI